MVAFIARTEADPSLYDKIRYTNEVTTSSPGLYMVNLDLAIRQL